MTAKGKVEGSHGPEEKVTQPQRHASGPTGNSKLAGDVLCF